MDPGFDAFFDSPAPSRRNAVHTNTRQSPNSYRIHDLFDDQSASSGHTAVDRHFLMSRARWIRDDLDHVVARDGPGALQPDVITELLRYFALLRKATVGVDQVRWSRMHCALLEIAGKATRWPPKIIDAADALIEHWEKIYGALELLGTPLYEEGGKLHGISTAEDLSRETLLIKWARKTELLVSPAAARVVGDLGFKPGDWWINALFAYRDGIVDNGNSIGGISADKRSAYALLLTYDDEISSPDPNHFTYRAKAGDTNKYRLTAAGHGGRAPIRVLRSHTLRSFWSPRAGVRYDGLHQVTSWSVRFDPSTKTWTYDVRFDRLDTETSMTDVLRRPFAEDIDDYKEYKRLRKATQIDHGHHALYRAKPLSKTGPQQAASTTDTDAASFVGEDGGSAAASRSFVDSVVGTASFETFATASASEDVVGEGQDRRLQRLGSVSSPTVLSISRVPYVVSKADMEAIAPFAEMF